MTTSSINPIYNFMADVSNTETVRVKSTQESEPKSANKIQETAPNKSEKSSLIRTVTDSSALQSAERTVNNSLLSYFNEKVSFDIDEKTQKTVIKIIDKKTDEVIKQFPAQEFLDMVHALNKAAKLVLKDLPKYM